MLVRVEVEPCELELSNDRLLPLATLQAAFPGCTGLSYKAEDGSKRALSFDGQAFHPPQQGWEQVKQFTVGLGEWGRGTDDRGVQAASSPSRSTATRTPPSSSSAP